MAKKQPATKAEATKLAKELKSFLDKETGVKWTIRVWNNYGWHFALGFGTVSVYTIFDTSKCKYLIMNGATSLWAGNIELKTLNATSGQKLLLAIKITLNAQKALVEKYIEEYQKHKFMKQFPKDKLTIK